MLCIPKHKKGKKMGTTSDFLKLRSTASTIKLNEWHNNFSAVKKFAEDKKVPLVAVWSNGDNCSYCVKFEKTLMSTPFVEWQKTSKCAFWFGCSVDTNSEDKTKGVGYKWCRDNGKISQFPFVRIFWEGGKVDVAQTGATLMGTDSKIEKRSETLVANLKKILQGYTSADDSSSGAQNTKEYKIRLNEKLTVAKINKILDAIDANKGYCPCQPKSASSKCHCSDFKKNKKIGEPCICNIYVKQAK